MQPVIAQAEPVRVIHSDVIKQKLDVKKGQRESMISVRKDYSEKFRFNAKSPTAAASLLDHAYENVSPSIASPSLHSSMPSGKLESKKKEKFIQPLSPTSLTNGKDAAAKRLMPSITILERHCYDKGPSQPKQIKVEPVEESLLCAIQSSQPFSSTHCSNNSNVPIKQSDVADSQITMGLDEFEVTVAQKADKPDAKPRVQSFKPQAEPKDSQNINRVNNKINIIFKLGDNSKSLRKNIILHRRTPKFQKITIKDKNKTQPDGVLSSSSIDTQTEIVQQRCAMNISNSKPLCDEPTGKVKMKKCLQGY